ncbi:MAG: ABC transporter permease [Planctomycetes bacterium]|nr:ABC transporter permease [Planctomycetota bacterium]
MVNKTAMVARREFLENVRTKTFWIGILMFPVIWALVLTVPSLFRKAEGVRKYAIVDKSEQAWFTKEFDRRTRMPAIEKLLAAWKDESRRDSLPANLGNGFFRFVSHLPDDKRGRFVQEMQRNFDPKVLDQVSAFVGAEVFGKAKQQLLEQVDASPEEFESQLKAIEDLLPISVAEQVPEADVLRGFLTWMRPSLEAADDAKTFFVAFIEATKREFSALREWWWNLATSKDERQLGLAKEFQSSNELGRFERVDPTDEDDLRKRVDEGKLFALFIVPEDPVGKRPKAKNGSTVSKDDEDRSSPQFKYITTKEHLADRDLRGWFEDEATKLVRGHRTAMLGVNDADAKWLGADIRLDDSRMEGGEEAEVSKSDLVGQFAPVVFVYLLWISVFTIANLLLTNTIEEKSNRLIEVLLSSVSPLQLMMGKILGLAATGLTMVGSWAFFAFLGIKLAPLLGENVAATIADWGLGQIVTNPRYVASFLIYFVFGYLLYAALLVGIGSVCNSLKEAQNLMQPVVLLLIVPLLAMIPIAREPNGMLAKIMSYIPPFTPFVMMNRAGGPPTLVEYGLTTVLLIATVFIAILFAAKIFRIGILMTGKPPKVREIFSWLKAPVGSVYVREDQRDQD